jgi:negative regulator of sigma E activity
MDAFFARNRLSAYLDGDLPEAEAAEVAAALERDAELRGELEGMQEAVRLLRAVGSTRAPPGFEARVMARVEAEGGGGVVVRLRDFVRRLPVEALALAAAAAVVVIVIQGRPEDSGERAATAEGPLTPDAGPPALQAAAPRAEPSEASADPTPGPQDLDAQAPRRSGPRAPTPGEVGEVYVPDWEREDGVQQATLEGSPAAGPEDAAAQPAEDAAPAAPAGAPPVESGPPPRGFQLMVSDPSVQYQLVNLVEGLGGQAFDRRGRPTRGAMLTEEDNFTSLRLLVPAAKGPDLERQLSGLGARASGATAGMGPVNAEQMGFVVEISFNP